MCSTCKLSIMGGSLSAVLKIPWWLVRLASAFSLCFTPDMKRELKLFEEPASELKKNSPNIILGEQCSKIILGKLLTTSVWFNTHCTKQVGVILNAWLTDKWWDWNPSGGWSCPWGHHHTCREELVMSLAVPGTAGSVPQVEGVLHHLPPCTKPNGSGHLEQVAQPWVHHDVSRNQKIK